MRVLRRVGYLALPLMLLQVGGCLVDQTPLPEQINTFVIDFARQALAAALL